MIPEWFLVVSLFVPRISILILYFQSAIPPNPMPLIADLLMSIFVPRAMVLIFIAANCGFGGWFWVHLVMAILVYAGGVSNSSSD